MQCPKCGHTQDDTVKCEACGVYFAKLRQPPASTITGRGDGPKATPKTSGFGLGPILLTALVSGIVVFVFTRREASSVSGNVSAARSATDATSGAAARTAPAPLQNAPAARGLEAQLARSFPAHSPVEIARNATVFIKTGWGLGSGFIIDEDCHVITNRHVVDSDGARVANSVVQDPEVKARIAMAQQQLMVSINNAQRQRQALVSQPGTNLERLELDNRIKAMQADLADTTGRVSQIVSQKVEGSGRSGFTATLVDGTEYTGLHAEAAANIDLAIFTLPADHCPHIVAGSSARLSLGERLYTIGSPSGLAYSVTSGVFSGERGQGSDRLLQTDAPINPGNSGGPLITSGGQVVGINSLMLRGTQGIGFAIPIEAAFQEFAQIRTTPRDGG